MNWEARNLNDCIAIGKRRFLQLIPSHTHSISLGSTDTNYFMSCSREREKRRVNKKQFTVSENLTFLKKLYSQRSSNKSTCASKKNSHAFQKQERNEIEVRKFEKS